jgi:hypothetical protein
MVQAMSQRRQKQFNTNPRGWRTVDVIVAAVIAVAFGVVFWAWTQFYDVASPAFNSVPPGCWSGCGWCQAFSAAW